MTTCWSTLEIPENSDRPEIRKAYARLIKKFRPDENPQQFQAIHDAYQEALARLLHPRVGNIQSGDEPGISQAEAPSEGGNSGSLEEVPEELLPPGMTRETFERINDAIENMKESEMIVEVDDFRITRGETLDQGFRIEKLYSPDTDAYRAGLSDEHKRALDQALATLDDILNSSDVANARHWDFLENCPYLLDSQFRYQLTGDVLRKIAQYNLSRNAASQAPVGVTAMYCLDQYLDFSRASVEDYHQLTEQEWNALRMPNRLGAGEPVVNDGLKGGKLVGGRDHAYTPAPEPGFWFELLKFSIFGVVAVFVLLGFAALVHTGKGSFIYVFAIIAAIKFVTAVLDESNKKS